MIALRARKFPGRVTILEKMLQFNDTMKGAATKERGRPRTCRIATLYMCLVVDIVI